MPHSSAPELLVLHGLRLMGMAEPWLVARRFGLDRALATEVLLDHQARGWVSRVGFADLTGWALTEPGHAELRRLLADELRESGAHGQVSSSTRGSCR